MEAIGFTDGSVLVIVGLEPPPSPTKIPAPGTLSVPGDITYWIAEAVAAGVTFDVLKATVSSLMTKGWNRQSISETTAESITQSVLAYLSICGYENMRITEARLVQDGGWTFAGTADDCKFSGIADVHGNLIHIHVR